MTRPMRPSVLARDCYRPDYVRYGLLRQTDYQYNDKGQLTRRLAPADRHGVRRRTIVEYADHVGLSRRKACGPAAPAPSATESTRPAPNMIIRRHPARRGRAADRRRERPALTTIFDMIRPAGWEDRRSAAGSDDTTHLRYDVHGRKIWEIARAQRRLADGEALRLSRFRRKAGQRRIGHRARCGERGSDRPSPAPTRYDSHRNVDRRF